MRALRRRFIVASIAALGAASLWRMGLLNPGQIAAAGNRLAVFAGDMMPPRTDALPLLGRAMLETIEIAFVGTLLGFLGSLPLAFLGTRSLFGPAVSSAARMLVGAIRSVPSILLGVIFVVACGLGPAAGVLGVACYTVGYLTKLYYETFEAVDAEVLEAVKSSGANRLQLWRHAILPEAANTVISQVLFMFEYNIRASTIMGFVGAGGIGYYMLGYIQMLQYQHLTTALLLTFAVVMSVDALSFRLRRMVLPHSPVR